MEGRWKIHHSRLPYQGMHIYCGQRCENDEMSISSSGRSISEFSSRNASVRSLETDESNEASKWFFQIEA